MARSYLAQVRGYLDDCAAHPGLDRRHHPTEDGAVKLIWHPRDEEDQVRAAFHALTTSPAISAAPGGANAVGRRARAATPMLDMTGDDPHARPA